MKEDFRMIGSLQAEELNVCQAGALMQKVMEENLDGTQAKIGLSFLGESNRELK